MSIYLNKERVDLEGVTIYTEEGRSMIPLKIIAQLTGAKVDYDAKAKEIRIKSKDKSIVLKINSSKALINDRKVETIAKHVLRGNTVMVPLRFISEALDVYIEYDKDRQRIYLNTLKYNVPDNIIEGYMLAIDSIYNEDKGLNDNSKYIAIDTSHMRYLNKADKAKLLKQMERYGIIIEATYKELEQRGLIKDLCFEEGILIEIDDLSSQENQLILDISKWKSGLGAIGYNAMVLEKENNIWEITKKGITWIS